MVYIYTYIWVCNISYYYVTAQLLSSLRPIKLRMLSNNYIIGFVSRKKPSRFACALVAMCLKITTACLLCPLFCVLWRVHEFGLHCSAFSCSVTMGGISELMTYIHTLQCIRWYLLRNFTSKICNRAMQLLR